MPPSTAVLKKPSPKPVKPQFAREEDDEVAKNSLAARVADLEVGESVARAEEIVDDHFVADVIANGPTRRQSLRDRTTPAVRSAKAKTGGSYSIEVADTIMPSGRIYTVAIVTRTA